VLLLVLLLLAVLLLLLPLLLLLLLLCVLFLLPLVLTLRRAQDFVGGIADLGSPPGTGGVIRCPMDAAVTFTGIYGSPAVCEFHK